MAVETTHSRFREDLPVALDNVVDNKEIVILRLCGSKGTGRSVAREDHRDAGRADEEL